MQKVSDHLVQDQMQRGLIGSQLVTESNCHVHLHHTSAFVLNRQGSQPIAGSLTYSGTYCTGPWVFFFVSQPYLSGMNMTKKLLVLLVIEGRGTSSFEECESLTQQGIAKPEILKCMAAETA